MSAPHTNHSNSPFDDGRYDPPIGRRSRSTADIMHDPKKRIWLIAGLALLSLLLAVALYSSTGTRDARRDLRAATGNIYDARKNVEEARQVLEQRLAELQEAEASAIAQSERLDAEIVRERDPRAIGGVNGVVNGAGTGAAAGTLATPLTAEERAALTLQRTNEQLQRGGAVRQP